MIGWTTKAEDVSLRRACSIRVFNVRWTQFEQISGTSHSERPNLIQVPMGGVLLFYPYFVKGESTFCPAAPAFSGFRLAYLPLLLICFINISAKTRIPYWALYQSRLLILQTTLGDTITVAVRQHAAKKRPSGARRTP